MMAYRCIGTGSRRILDPDEKSREEELYKTDGPYLTRQPAAAAAGWWCIVRPSFSLFLFS